MENLKAPVRRPPAVSIVVLMFILNIIFAIFTGVLMLYELGVLGVPDPLGVLQALGGTYQGLIQLARIVIETALIVILIAATIGLYQLRRWAWTLGMLILGIGLAFNLLNFLRGDPDYVLMLGRVVAVILLDQEPVRFAFGTRPGAYE
jgi:hypothetical protein